MDNRLSQMARRTHTLFVGVPASFTKAPLSNVRFSLPLLLGLALLWMGQVPSQAEVEVWVGHRGGKSEKPDKNKAASPKNVNEPFSIDFDDQGVAYGVEFTKSNRLFRINKGDPEFFAGLFGATEEKKPVEPGDGTHFQQARFNGLHDIAVAADGMIYLADTFNHRIRRIDLKSKSIETIAGDGKPGFQGDGGTAKEAQFNQPYCCSLAPDQQSLYIADLANQRLRKIDLATGKINTVAGNGKKGKPSELAKAVDSPLNGPRAAAVAKDGTVYLVQREGNSVLEIRKGVLKTVVNLAGKIGNEGDDGPALEARLNGPKYLCLDPDDNLLIVDTENHAIRHYLPKTGTIQLVAGVPGRSGNTVGKDWKSTLLNRPHGVRIDGQKRLIVVDSENDRILRSAYE